MILLLAATALAGTPGVNLAGGFDQATLQPWAGVEGVWHTLDTDTLLAPHARVGLGYGAVDQRLFGRIEGGLLFDVPNQTEGVTVRLGAIARTLVGPHPKPAIILADPDPPSLRFGLIPAALVALEFVWTDVKNPVALGVRAGPGSAADDRTCDIDEPERDCLGWSSFLVGGAWGRVWIARRVVVEATVGPDMELRLGVTF